MVIYQNLSQNQKRKNKTIKNQMTFLYTRTNSWNSTPQEKPTEQTIKVWNHISQNTTKEN